MASTVPRFYGKLKAMMNPLPLLILVGLIGLANPAQAAMKCNQIREKAKSKKGKAACVLIEHTVGIESGSSVSVYQCGGTKYVLTQQEDASCKVTTKK